MSYPDICTIYCANWATDACPNSAECMNTIDKQYFKPKKRKRKKVFIFKPTPTVAVEPVQRGTWDFDRNYAEYVCSECDGIGMPYYQYCPRCGARMQRAVET